MFMREKTKGKNGSSHRRGKAGASESRDTHPLTAYYPVNKPNEIIKNDKHVHRGSVLLVS